FAGYGLDAPAAGHVDFRDKNVQGAAVVWLGMRGPKGVDQGAYRRLLAGRNRYATEQLGAAASIGPAPEGQAGRAGQGRGAGQAGGAGGAGGAGRDGGDGGNGGVRGAGQEGVRGAGQEGVRGAGQEGVRGAGQEGVRGTGQEGARGTDLEGARGFQPSGTRGGRGVPIPAADFTTVQRLDAPAAPNVAASDAFFEFLFSRAPTKYDELKRKAAAQEPLPSFALTGVTITFDVNPEYQIVRTQLTHNIVGIVEGSDPQLKRTYVAFGAHYDH